MILMANKKNIMVKENYCVLGSATHPIWNIPLCEFYAHLYRDIFEITLTQPFIATRHAFFCERKKGDASRGQKQDHAREDRIYLNKKRWNKNTKIEFIWMKKKNVLKG